MKAHESQRILRLPTVREVTGLSRSSIYAYLEKGEFPQPIKISTRSVGWLAIEIDAWILSRASKRGQ
jgi:prophage regulatory protein